MVSKNNLERFKNATQFKQTPKQITWGDVKNEWCLTLSQIINDEIRGFDEDNKDKLEIIMSMIEDEILDKSDDFEIRTIK
tara:strand:+ start:279 stop:518 length:240 start_codon:yes stop_codon:yes gene_type:complete